MQSILKIFFSIIILFLLIAYFYITTQLSEKCDADNIIIIPKNCSIRCISNILSEKKIINKKFAFYYLVFSDFLGRKILAGEYQINTGETFREILNKFTYGKVIIHKMTVPEGFTTQQIINLLQSQKNIINDISEVDIYPEGVFFPTTYQYLYGTTATELLSKMRNEMEKVLNAQWKHRDIKSDYKYKNITEAMIVASIIEKEAVFESEKDIIASVYINRLLKNMFLQADPTVIYGISRWKDFNRKVLYKDLKIRSLYNTYIYRGLPPTPICNPGKSSIYAAMHPTQTDFLYFVANKDGTHIFSKTYKKHLKNIKHINKNANKDSRN